MENKRTSLEFEKFNLLQEADVKITLKNVRLAPAIFAEIIEKAKELESLINEQNVDVAVLDKVKALHEITLKLENIYLLVSSFKT